jgi:hypothetical protein
MLVRDHDPAYPNFMSSLYMQLDYQMVLLYIMWWFFFDHYTDNDVLAVFLVYILERILRELRAWLGKRNIVVKCMFDERFLV